MTDQPGFGLVTGLAENPPYAFPVSFTPSTAVPFVSLQCLTLWPAAALLRVRWRITTKTPMFPQWNFGIDQQLASDFKVTARYVGSKGTDLNIERNHNQLVNGVRPYPLFRRAARSIRA